MILFDDSSREFIARNIADLGKAILTVGFASYFFEKFPLYMRIGFPLIGFILLFGGVVIHAWKGKRK
ncbi:MAG: hypothetical protein HYZ83_06025 [Candidatus Omnitrophica bacterium]|nr:hypothetical protein [Candidatus Omnitrophota bacterium]